MLVCSVSGVGKKELGDDQNKKILIGFPPEQKKKTEKNGPDPLSFKILTTNIVIGAQ